MKQSSQPTGKGNAYRLFFAAAALQAIVSPFLLLCIRQGYLEPLLLITPGLWHAQEMIFGYALLVIAGYLITHISAATLFGLMLLWFLGRWVWFAGEELPEEAVVILASAFPLALSWLTSAKFKAAKRLRNRIFSFIFWGLGMLATIFYALVYAQNFAAAYQTLYILIYLITLFIIIMGGRLIPPATIGALRVLGKEVRIPFQSTYETLCMALAISLMLLELLPLAPFWKALPALALAVILLLRLSQWRSGEILNTVSLWPLHLGYLWLAAGFGLIACARLEIALSTQDALHAITIGGIGVITLTMLVRVSSQRGAPGKVSPVLMWCIQSALFMAVLLRLATYSLPSYSDYLLWLSAAAWSLAFLFFLYGFYPASRLLRTKAFTPTDKPRAKPKE